MQPSLKEIAALIAKLKTKGVDIIYGLDGQQMRLEFKKGRYHFTRRELQMLQKITYESWNGTRNEHDFLSDWP